MFKFSKLCYQNPHTSSSVNSFDEFIVKLDADHFANIIRFPTSIIYSNSPGTTKTQCVYKAFLTWKRVYSERCQFTEFFINDTSSRYLAWLVHTIVSSCNPLIFPVLLDSTSYSFRVHSISLYFAHAANLSSFLSPKDCMIQYLHQ